MDDPRALFFLGRKCVELATSPSTRAEMAPWLKSKLSDRHCGLVHIVTLFDTKSARRVAILLGTKLELVAYAREDDVLYTAIDLEFMALHCMQFVRLTRLLTR